MTNFTIARELSAHLDHLAFVGQDQEGQLQWIGEQKDWQKVENELKPYVYNHGQL